MQKFERKPVIKKEEEKVKSSVSGGIMQQKCVDLGLAVLSSFMSYKHSLLTFQYMMWC